MESENLALFVSQVVCVGDHAATVDCAYQVAWSINPHMRVGSVDVHRAQRQHERFTASLRRLGAEVTELPFVHGAFDSVFAKDNALLVTQQGRRRALLARPRCGERASEQAPRAHALERAGFDVSIAHGEPIEGGDIVMLPNGGGALLGYGFRSSRGAAAGLASFLGADVLPLKLRDPALYHLDTALFALNDGTLLVCPEAFTNEGLRALEAHPAVRDIAYVPREEALRFGVNLVQIGATLLVGGPAPTVAYAARARGLRLEITPLDEFQLAGGSAACLVSHVHALDAATTAAAA